MNTSRGDVSRTQKNRSNSSFEPKGKDTAPCGTGIRLEDGNAGKETEELQPSPNFDVLIGCSEEKKKKSRQLYFFLLLIR